MQKIRLKHLNFLKKKEIIIFKRSKMKGTVIDSQILKIALISNDVIDEIWEEEISSGKKIVPDDFRVFNSEKSYRRFMTMQKLDIISALYIGPEQSLTHLLSTLDRDKGNLFRDLKSLEGMQFLRSEEKNGKTVYSLFFDYYGIMTRRNMIHHFDLPRPTLKGEIESFERVIEELRKVS